MILSGLQIHGWQALLRGFNQVEKPKKKPKKKMGRPRVHIDWVEVKKLCQLQCTLSEIADWFLCSENTVVRRCKEENKTTFEGYFKKHSAKGKVSLRRSQFKLAADGNPALNIWLGKQYLGQTDKSEVKTEVTGKDGGAIEVKKKMTIEEMEKEMKRRGIPIPDIGGVDLE